MAKLSSFDTCTRANTGVEKELTDLRTGKGSGAFITVLGTDSDKFKEIKAESARAMAERMAERNVKELTVQEMERLQCETLAACTVGWRELEDEDGVTIPFSHARALELYTKYPPIRDQVNYWIGERRNFLAP